MKSTSSQTTLIHAIDVAHEIVERVRSFVASNPSVRKLEKCCVRKTGFDYSADIRIRIDDTLGVTECHVIVQEVRASLLESKWRIRGVLVHVEPREGNYFLDDDEYWLA